MPFRSASTISPVISTLSSFCAMSASFRLLWGVKAAGLGPAAEVTCLREEVHVCGLGALVALLGLALHLCTLRERPVAAALDRAEVDEQVLATLIGGDEPVTLVRVEPLDSSGCHICLSPPCHTSLNGQDRAEPAPSTTRSNCSPDCSVVERRRAIHAAGRRRRSWRRNSPPRGSSGRGRPRGSQARVGSGRASCARRRSRRVSTQP